jgi:hypothetical protein
MDQQIVNAIVDELRSKFDYGFTKLPIGVLLDPYAGRSYFDPTPTNFNDQVGGYLDCEIKTFGTLTVNRRANRFHKAVYIYCRLEFEKNIGSPGGDAIVYVAPAPGGAYRAATRLKFLNDRLRFITRSPVGMFYNSSLAKNTVECSLLYGDPDFFESALNLLVLNCYIAFFTFRAKHDREWKKNSRKIRRVRDERAFF